MKQYTSALICLLSLLAALSLTGCQGRPVPHLAANVIKLDQGMSAKEVKAYLGEPDYRQKGPEGQRWIYVHKDKSFLRKTPLIGRFMGSVTMNVVTVDFTQNEIASFQYQTMTPKKFKEEGYRDNG